VAKTNHIAPPISPKRGGQHSPKPFPLGILDYGNGSEAIAFDTKLIWSHGG